MKNLLILTVLLLANLANSQKVEFIEKNDTIQKPKWQQFVYLFPETNKSNAILVSKVKVTGNIKNITAMFETIKSETQKIGSNAFVVENFNKIDTENGELVLSTYFCEEELLEENFLNTPKNKIYIFGNQNMINDKKQSFKVEGIKHEIDNGKFAVFEVEIGKEVKINKGGFSGMTLLIVGQENKAATFLSFSGLGLGGGNYNPGYNQVGVSFNTGRINKIEQNFAMALTKIFDEQK